MLTPKTAASCNLDIVILIIFQFIVQLYKERANGSYTCVDEPT